jgi:hypothetical protein
LFAVDEIQPIQKQHVKVYVCIGLISARYLP